MIDSSAKELIEENKTVFLAHCSVSPLYRSAAQAMTSFVEDMAAGGITQLPKYFQVMAEFHENAAKLLRTSAKNISYVHNTAEALCMIANGYPFSPGDEVISYIHEYPSNHYPWAMQTKRGVRLELLSDVAPIDGLGSVSKPKGWSINELQGRLTKRTRIVALSHVQFTSGYAADLEELGRLCRENGTDLIVDCAQSLGCLPVYPEEYHISAIVSSGWKWLMGPKGSGLLYTSDALRDKLEITMAGPGTMHQGLDYLDHSWVPFNDGRMFEYSTLPWDHVAGMSAVIKEIFLQYSPEDIRNEVFRLQDLLVQHLDPDIAKLLRFDDKNRSGILAADPKKDFRLMVKGLAEKGVVVSAPIGYLRLAPHFYIDDIQIVRAAELINTVADSLP